MAAAAGAEILAAGGNAVDAAVATSATLGVVEPFASGIGGGGFLLSYRADTNQVTALDCRETAPAAVTPDALIETATGKPYADNTLLSGGLSVGVPGQVECWSEAVRRFGRLSLMQDLQPAIRAARTGFDVTPYFNHEIGLNRTRLAEFPETAAHFLPNGRPLAVGSHFVQTDLCRHAGSHRAAGRGQGSTTTFYDGSRDRCGRHVASRCVEPCLPAGGGPHDHRRPGHLSDRGPRALSTTYRGYMVVTASAPSSGATLLETLNLLSGFDLAGLGADAPTSVHLLGEAQRLADADRARWLGDPDFGSVPYCGLIAPAYADLRRAQLASDQVSPGTTNAIQSGTGQLPIRGHESARDATAFSAGRDGGGARDGQNAPGCRRW